MSFSFQKFHTTSRKCATRSWRAIAPAVISRSSSSPKGAFPKGGTVSLIGDSLPGESRRAGRPVRTHRARDSAHHGQGNPLARSRTPAARRHADRIRPPARHALWRRGCSRRRRREVGAHGRASIPAHRHDSDRRGASRTQAGRSDATTSCSPRAPPESALATEPRSSSRPHPRTVHSAATDTAE